MEIEIRQSQGGPQRTSTVDGNKANEQDGQSSDHRLRVSELIPDFLEYLRVEESRSPATLDRYKHYLERLVKAVGDCPAEAINGEKVSIYKGRLMEGGLSPSTISVMLSCLRTFLRYVRDIKMIPTHDPEKVRRPKIPRREVDYLTGEEVYRFVTSIPVKTLGGLRDRALVAVLCSSGMRISEALSLNRDAIDWTGQGGEGHWEGK